MRAPLLRLLGAILFLPLALPFVVLLPCILLFLACRFIVIGPDEEATERILLNPCIEWTAELPVRLFQIANRL